jgi:hypothetical protein
VSDQPATAAEAQSAIEAEYSKWVAKHAIDIHGARAFNAGDPVPASHVERGVVSRDDVVGPDTKAGRAAAGVTEKG